MVLGSEIRDPEKTYSGSRIQGSKSAQFRISDPDPQHWLPVSFRCLVLPENACTNLFCLVCSRRLCYPAIIYDYSVIGTLCCLTSCLPRSIMEGKFSFTSTEWRDVTTAPKDLISRILVVDYRQRPTVQQCLSHEFFRESRRDSMNEVAEPFQSRRLFRRVELGDMQRFR